MITLQRDSDVGEQVVAYVNRLSDALFVMARFENLESGVDEPLWRPGE
jgi:cob(I)alamin adenosyltransferase